MFEGSADFQVGDELYHAKKGLCVHISQFVQLA